MDANRILIIDLYFLTELLTSGVYWTIFGNLPPNKRETFRQLWGRLFEIYAVDLLKEFYQKTCGMLHPDVQYKTGQIDALLDLGNVVVFEIKSSLLTEVAKRATNSAAFVADYERKFVRNAKSAPKAGLATGGSLQGGRGWQGSDGDAPAQDLSRLCQRRTGRRELFRQYLLQ